MFFTNVKRRFASGWGKGPTLSNAHERKLRSTMTIRIPTQQELFSSTSNATPPHFGFPIIEFPRVEN